jgi:hypothetical protein
LPIAQLIAEQHPHAAHESRTERSADRTANLWLADGVERERRVEGDDREVVATSQPAGGVGEIRRD